MLALISLLLWQFVRSSGAAAIIAGVSAVAALVCGVLWHNHCPADGTLAFAAGLTLCLIAVVCTDLMAHRAKEGLIGDCKLSKGTQIMGMDQA